MNDNRYYVLDTRQSNSVVNIIVAEPDFEPGDGLIKISTRDLELGFGWWQDEDGTWKEPVELTIPPQMLMDYAMKKQYEKETSGTIFNSMVIPTDDRTKLFILQMATGLDEYDFAPLIVHGVYWGNQTKSTFQSIHKAITNHVKETQKILVDVLLKIKDEQITKVSQVDAHFA